MNIVLVWSAVIAIGAWACTCDLRTRRIPNKLTFTATAVAVILHGTVSGLSGIATSLAGTALGIALFLPWFALGGMGAGDVKLLAAFGAWLGPLATIWMALYAGVAGGVMAVVVALTHGYLRQAIGNIWGMILQWAAMGPTPIPHLTLEQDDAPRLAYALPITFGALVSLWLR